MLPFCCVASHAETYFFINWLFGEMNLRVGFYVKIVQYSDLCKLGKQMETKYNLMIA
jgi:hypothetical protein